MNEKCYIRHFSKKDKDILMCATCNDQLYAAIF
jgi:hypothetical protein